MTVISRGENNNNKNNNNKQTNKQKNTQEDGGGEDEEEEFANWISMPCHLQVEIFFSHSKNVANVVKRSEFVYTSK